MKHPFEALSPSARKRGLIIFSVLAALVTIVMAWLDSKYRTPATPIGIVSFELARTPMMAQMILDSWSREPGMNSWVGFSLGFDYVYLTLYSTAFAFIAVAMAKRLEPSAPGLAKIARAVAWFQLVAAICDAIENAALMAMLVRIGTDPWALVAAVFASIKFAFLGTFISLILFVGPLALRAKPVTTESN